MTQIEDVAAYVREHGKDGRKIPTREIAEKIGTSMAAVADCRTKLMRTEDDIFPVEPSTIAYFPDWKTHYPEIWAAAQERSRLQRSAINNRHKREGRQGKRRSQLPNVMGPIITLHNVVAVNIHDDHVAVQHEDGSWTELTGKLTMRNSHHG